MEQAAWAYQSAHALDTIPKWPTVRKDDRVSLEETELIFKNLAGPKELKLYPEAGHESILMKYESGWIEAVVAFVDGGLSRDEG